MQDAAPQVENCRLRVWDWPVRAPQLVANLFLFTWRGSAEHSSLTPALKSWHGTSSSPPPSVIQSDQSPAFEICSTKPHRQHEMRLDGVVANAPSRTTCTSKQKFAWFIPHPFDEAVRLRRRFDSNRPNFAQVVYDARVLTLSPIIGSSNA